MFDAKQGCHDDIYKAEINLVFYTMLEHIGLPQFEVSTWFCTCFPSLASLKYRNAARGQQRFSSTCIQSPCQGKYEVLSAHR